MAWWVRRKCRHSWGEYRHITGVIVSAASLQLRNQRFSRPVAASRLAHGCCCRDSERHRWPSTGLPGSSALHLSSSGSPCFRSTRSGILRASRFGMVEALATTALSGGVLLLENGLACSNLLLAGSWRASLINLRQAVAQIGAQRRRILRYDSGSGCRRIFALRRQGRLRRRGRCGCHYLYRPG